MSTFNNFLENAVNNGLDKQLATLLSCVANESKNIAACVRQGELAGIFGSADSENIQGETQKKLDIIANDMLLHALSQSGVVAAVASEEMEDCCPVQDGESHPFLILFDPLDGSSNIDVNVSIGTIFSILPNPTNGVIGNDSFLQPGTAQVAAGYVVYGPQTTLVLTTGSGVDMFTLNPEVNDFIHTGNNIQIDRDTKEFAINMSNVKHWFEPVSRYIDEVLAGKTGVRGKDFNMRWIASMVADVHRVLSRGGIFMYPRDKRDPSKPGKLRLMYEANPMSFLVEQAGGKSYAESTRIMEIKPSDLHQRCAVMLGSANEIDRLVEYHSKN